MYHVSHPDNLLRGGWEERAAHSSDRGNDTGDVQLSDGGTPTLAKNVVQIPPGIRIIQDLIQKSSPLLTYSFLKTGVEDS